ncbi:unnamed protein product [Mesocestoides corti]|uniref:Expressed conserved protein n=1 Tax=Mesocestoides corti TaxID=53468 RepID=A0A0R3UL61_MESCO|nr:unnamed protein product [Mesocestoides corti]
MDLITLTVPLTCLAIGLCVTSLVLPKWSCGGFFTTCVFTLLHIIVLGLIIGGLGLLTLIFIIDICGACRTKWVPGPLCTSYKMILTTLAAGCLLSGNLLYAVFYVKSWSFILSYSGAVIAVHVVVISFFGSRCCHNN